MRTLIAAIVLTVLFSSAAEAQLFRRFRRPAPQYRYVQQPQPQQQYRQQWQQPLRQQQQGGYFMGSTGRPQISSYVNYRRQIDPRAQAVAEQEVAIFARYSFETYQGTNGMSNAGGHPLGTQALVPTMGMDVNRIVGGTGCTGKGGNGTLFTCEPPRGIAHRYTLIAEAVRQSPVDGTWYASRFWRLDR